MVSWRARAVVGMLRLHDTRRFYADPEAMRRNLAEHQDPARARPPARVRLALAAERSHVDGFACWTLRPRLGARTGMHVLHLHGGGYVEEMEPHHWRFAHWLVATTGCTVTFPMYPLAPRHDHRTIRPMARHSYERFLGPCVPRERVVLGDSAGGALALSIAQELRDRGEHQPARIALFSPWLDLSVTDPLALAIAPRDPVIGVAGLRQAGRWYAGAAALDDPEISPVHAELAGLGRIGVFVGTRDVLLADARMLRRDAERSGIDIALHEYPGMFHNWIMKPLPDAHAARRDLLRFLAPDA